MKKLHWMVRWGGVERYANESSPKDAAMYAFGCVDTRMEVAACSNKSTFWRTYKAKTLIFRNIFMFRKQDITPSR